MGKFNKKKEPSHNSTTAPRKKAELSTNPEYEAVTAWLKSVRFKKKITGGLDPEDVWKKLDELNTLYENALISERARYNMMLRQIMMGRDSEE